jgi:hypothetical protein
MNGPLALVGAYLLARAVCTSPSTRWPRPVAALIVVETTRYAQTRRSLRGT